MVLAVARIYDPDAKRRSIRVAWREVIGAFGQHRNGIRRRQRCVVVDIEEWLPEEKPGFDHRAAGGNRTLRAWPQTRGPGPIAGSPRRFLSRAIRRKGRVFSILLDKEPGAQLDADKTGTPGFDPRLDGGRDRRGQLVVEGFGNAVLHGREVTAARLLPAQPPALSSRAQLIPRSRRAKMDGIPWD